MAEMNKSDSLPDLRNGGLRPGKKWPQFLAATLATLCTICAGSVMGWTSPALPYLEKNGITSSEASWISSLAPLGALVGALPAGQVANYIGRKRLLLLLALPYVIGWSLIIVANNWAPLIFVGRFLGGIALGSGSVIAPIYCEEIAEVRVRGAVGVLFDLQVGNGILWAYVIGAYVPYFWFCIASGLLPIIFFITFIWMPESPIYLTSKGRTEDAENALRWLRGAKYIEGYDIKPELERIHQLVAKNNSDADSVETGQPQDNQQLVSIFRKIPKLLFFSKKSATFRAVKIVACLMILRQLSGINAIIFFTFKIFEDAGSTLSSSLSTIIVGVVQIVFTYFSSLLVERTGRRVLLLFSDIVMALCQIVLAVYFYLKLSDFDVSMLGWLPVACICTYIAVFNLGFGPLPWLMMAELVPNESKSWASGLGVSVNWILVFVITNTFGLMVKNLGPVVTFGIFGAMCGLGTILIALIVPETKGKTREQIRKELEK